MSVPRTKVRPLAIAAQAAAIALLLVLIGGAAAAVFLGVPGDQGEKALPEPPGPESFDFRPVSGGGEGGDEPDQPFDATGVAGVLADMPGAPRPEEEIAEDGGEGEADPPPARNPSRSEIEFVGAILAPSKNIAVLRYDGRQWWVAEGEERAIGGDGAERRVRVDEVQPEALDATIDGRARSMARARRSGPATAVAARPPEPEPAELDPAERRRMEQLEEIRRRARERGEAGGGSDEQWRARRSELENRRERQIERTPDGSIIYRPDGAEGAAGETPGQPVTGTSTAVPPNDGDGENPQR